MSEEKQSFMQQLDLWADDNVIAPLLEDGPEATEDVHKAIRAKVLESYHNGQSAGPNKWRPAVGHSRREISHAQPKAH